MNIVFIYQVRLSLRLNLSSLGSIQEEDSLDSILVKCLLSINKDSLDNIRGNLVNIQDNMVSIQDSLDNIKDNTLNSMASFPNTKDSFRKDNIHTQDSFSTTQAGVNILLKKDLEISNILNILAGSNSILILLDMVMISIKDSRDILSTLGLVSLVSLPSGRNINKMEANKDSVNILSINNNSS